MMSVDEPLATWLLLVARISLATVFLASGIHKAVWYRKAIGEFELARAPAVSITLPMTIVLHIVASACLILGVYVVEAALMLAGFLIVATILVHDFWNMSGAQRLDRSRIALSNLAIIGGLLLLAIAGPGRLVIGT